MTGPVSLLIAIPCDDDAQAHEGRDTVRGLRREAVVQLVDAIVATQDRESVELEQHHDLVASGTISGAF